MSGADDTGAGTTGAAEEPISGGDLRFGRAIDLVARSAEFVERPIRRAGGASRLNPVVHAGTISVFLLGVVIVTGLYITLFFEFGFAASYDSVAAMEEHPIQKIMRALHRYSSAALVFTTVVHAVKVFTSRRFVGHRRRWRWVSGVASLTLVWLAGVTGYWLVWDRRAAAISEAVAGVLSSTGAGTRFAVRHLLGISPGSGSGLLLVIWFAHLGLTAVLGWFVWRHLRRSKQPWLPPRNWMIVMGLALLAVSALLPVGMLDPARPDRLVADMPLDPFVLFLLPPLLSGWRWVALTAMVLAPLLITLVPRALTRRDPAVIEIDEDACTGCELCVLDCPFDALSMVRSVDSPGESTLVAQVDADQCVSCGICLGSCAFDAIELPGSANCYVPWGRNNSSLGSGASQNLVGRDVVVICDRHDPAAAAQGDGEVVIVRCAGMFAPGAVRTYAEQGAASVHLIGCAPSDCRYGTGNMLAAERLAGERAPHPARKFRDRIAGDWVSSDQVAWAREHPSESASSETSDLRRYGGAAVVVVLSVAAIVAATAAPFRSPEGARVRAVVDHVAGSELEGLELAPDRIDEVELVVDGLVLSRQPVDHDADASTDYVDWDVPAGSADYELRAIVDGDTVELASGSFDLDDREQLVLTATDVPPDPGSADGRRVFTSRNAGCTVCHSTAEGDDGVGPSLYGIASFATERVPGLSAEGYLRQSILLPDQYVVEGWPAGQMLPIYRERLDEQQLDALLTYLLTLTIEED